MALKSHLKRKRLAAATAATMSSFLGSSMPRTATMSSADSRDEDANNHHPHNATIEDPPVSAPEDVSRHCKEGNHINDGITVGIDRWFHFDATASAGIKHQDSRESIEPVRVNNTSNLHEDGTAANSTLGTTTTTPVGTRPRQQQQHTDRKSEASFDRNNNDDPDNADHDRTNCPNGYFGSEDRRCGSPTKIEPTESPKPSHSPRPAGDADHHGPVPERRDTQTLVIGMEIEESSPPQSNSSALNTESPHEGKRSLGVNSTNVAEEAVWRASLSCYRTNGVVDAVDISEHDGEEVVVRRYERAECDEGQGQDVVANSNKTHLNGNGMDPNGNKDNDHPALDCGASRGVGVGGNAGYNTTSAWAEHDRAQVKIRDNSDKQEYTRRSIATQPFISKTRRLGGTHTLDRAATGPRAVEGNTKLEEGVGRDSLRPEVLANILLSDCNVVNDDAYEDVLRRAREWGKAAAIAEGKRGDSDKCLSFSSSQQPFPDVPYGFTEIGRRLNVENHGDTAGSARNRHKVPAKRRPKHNVRGT